MTEILTESFCERCGTRYTFESNAPRRSRIGRMRTLSKGLRNFVMSDESSFSEAMADARSEEELVATSHQLDAFHQTFNFCLTCRQYTCSSCWNAAEGRCLTCAPMPGMEESAVADVSVVAQLDGNGHASQAADEAWPEADLDRIAAVLGEPAPTTERADTGVDVAAAPTTGDGARESELIGTPELTGESGPPPVESVAATDVPSGPGRVPGTPTEERRSPASDAFREEVARSTEAAPLLGVAPGQSLEDAIAAYEAQLAASEAAGEQGAAPAPPEPAPSIEPEPVVAAEPEPVSPEPPLAPLAPEPAAAAPTPVTPEPLPAEPAPPPAETQPTMPAAARGTDVIRQPKWPVPPPQTPEADVGAPGEPAASPWLRVAPDDAQPSAQPQWPAAPSWPAAADRDYPRTLAGRPLLPRDDAAALWAASAQEVLGPAPASQPAAPATPSPQPCVQCGLSLSANARFCRRCGSRQG